MHSEILDANQKMMLPMLKEFSKEYYLVGGTALALQIGHRKSIDFDLFTNKKIRRNIIEKRLDRKLIQKVMVANEDNFTLLYNNVNLTFFSYPYEIEANVKLGKFFKSPDILTIGAMKAYALGRRAKWKDYVDLYFILNVYRIEDLVELTQKIYGNMFNPKLFLEQLCYFEDINYSQRVDYIVDPIPDEKIKDFLVRTAVSL